MDLAELIVVDVGHGNCAVIHDGGRAVIVDAPASQTLPALLDALEITEIVCLLVSHADSDHVSGAISLLADSRRPVQQVFVNPDARNTNCWYEFRVAARDAHLRSGTRVVPSLCTTSPEEISIGNARVCVLYPTAEIALATNSGFTLGGIRLNANSMSGVVKVSVDEDPVCVLAADIDSNSLSEISEAGLNIQAPMLVFPHHGGLPGRSRVDSFVGALLENVDPKMIYISHGRNKFSNPRREIVEEIISGRFSSIFIGCSQVSKSCGAADKADMHGRVSEFSEGYGVAESCLGSVRMELTPGCVDKYVETAGLQHQLFVKRRLEKPMCQLCVK